MSAPLINRSLTTIRTELEFLHDSEVITEDLYNKLLQSLPNKYQKNMEAWGVDKLKTEASNDMPSTGTDSITDGLSSTTINPPTKPPRLQAPKTLGYCKANYDYRAQETEDLGLVKGDKIAVLEHLSEDWWKGYKQNSSPSSAGVFPSNYVSVISLHEFELTTDVTKNGMAKNEKAEYSPNTQYNVPPPPQYDQSTQQAPLAQQPSYGGYSQYPPPPTNYYPQQQYSPQPQYAVQPQEPTQAQTGSSGSLLQNPHLKKFGGKLGNAAIFGAGATIGSDLVHSIF